MMMMTMIATLVKMRMRMSDEDEDYLDVKGRWWYEVLDVERAVVFREPTCANAHACDVCRGGNAWRSAPNERLESASPASPPPPPSDFPTFELPNFSKLFKLHLKTSWNISICPEGARMSSGTCPNHQVQLGWVSKTPGRN